FDINELVGLKVERADAFDAIHRLVLQLVADNHVEGLRIDHIDGLSDPFGYLDRLSRAARAAAGKDIYILVEKILGAGESLRRDWPVAGTTGYEFANLLHGVQVAPAGRDDLVHRYQAFTGETASYADIVDEAKRMVIGLSFPGEVRALADR